jgi:hypothetical protein
MNMIMNMDTDMDMGTGKTTDIETEMGNRHWQL